MILSTLRRVAFLAGPGTRSSLRSNSKAWVLAELRIQIHFTLTSRWGIPALIGVPPQRGAQKHIRHGTTRITCSESEWCPKLSLKAREISQHPWYLRHNQCSNPKQPQMIHGMVFDEGTCLQWLFEPESKGQPPFGGPGQWFVS